jgi:predicted metal-dependent peptidase
VGSNAHHQPIKGNNMDAQLKISRCITKLLLSHPFWGSIALGTQFIKSDSTKTMATNGKWIKWGPSFVDGITEAETLGVIAHELCHIVLKHHLRRGDRSPKRWNYACDYVINPILKKDGFELPEGGLFDDQFINLTSERAYDMIPEPEGDDLWGEVNDDDIDPDAMSEWEAEIDQRIMIAANEAKNAGKLPHFIEGIIAQMQQNQVDWRDKLRRFVQGDQPDDYSYARPERKAFHHLGLIAPSITRRGAGNIVVGVDTSASVGDEELRHFLGEVNALSNEVNPLSITVIYCDTNINNVERYEQGDEIKVFSHKSRGGTLVQPVFDYIRHNGIEVDHMIYLTDLEVWDFPTSVDFPLLWVSSSPTAKAPIGETVTITIK